MSDYMRFTEHNEWEGETWNFWIPVDGNAESLDALKNLVDGENYEVGDSLPELAVDVLVAANAWDDNCSYMSANTKLVGKLVIPDHTDAESPVLNKGGIRSFMQ